MSALTLSPQLQKLVDLALAWRVAHMQRVRTEEAKLEFRKAWGAMPMELGQEAFLEIDRLTRELAAERERLEWCPENVHAFGRSAVTACVVEWIDDNLDSHTTRGSDWRSTIDEAMREDRRLQQPQVIRSPTGEDSETMSDTRDFDLGDVLSITDGRLVSPRLIEGVYDILNFMTGDSLYTHQLPRAMRACQGPLLAQHPQLADVDRTTKLGPDNFREWLAAQKRIYGETLPVAPLAPQTWTQINPVLEAEALVGKDRVIAVEAPAE